MQKVLLAVVCLLGYCGASFAEDQPLPKPLTYVHWNIGHFAMGRACDTAISAAQSDARAKAYLALIDALDADVIGCSEYDPVFDQAGADASQKIFSSFDTAILGPKNSFVCNAIFSKGLRLVKSEIVNHNDRWEQKYFIDATYRIAGREVHFVQAHLDWNVNEKAKAIRPKQIQQMIERFAKYPYVVIAGDFNTYASAEYEPFRQAGYTLANCGAKGELITCGKANDKLGFHALDNIIVKGFSISQVKTEDTDYRLSDHTPLCCTLTWLPVKPRSEK